MVRPRRTSVMRPTIDTPFHIDFEWWKQRDRDWHIYLVNLLCDTHREQWKDARADETLDWVDQTTGEVRPVNAVQYILMRHCAQQPNFLTPQGGLVDQIFRVLLAHGNAPMTPRELGERLQKSPQVILRVLAGPRVYRGIRPVHAPGGR
ncbi:MAG: hypothetical protein GXO36_00770 [Chloroflexi bacterium]|nr:hypothetical protein [Chloroflexota bacterium]